MKALRLSQAELARRVGVRQPTIHKLLNNQRYGSTHLHLIARELGTTPAYLTGETDDPDENAPPPLPAPQHQVITMQVLLPSEAALTRMFRGFLASLDGLHEVDLAHELAMLLPSGLGQLRGPLREELSVEAESPSEAAEDVPTADREQRRALRT